MNKKQWMIISNFKSSLPKMILSAAHLSLVKQTTFAYERAEIAGKANKTEKVSSS